jgi:hypothetical protein
MDDMVEDEKGVLFSAKGERGLSRLTSYTVRARGVCTRSFGAGANCAAAAAAADAAGGEIRRHST